MPKKHTKNNVFEKRYTKEQLKEHIYKDVDNLKFQEHCNEVAKNLKIDPVVVRDLLLHNSFIVLWLIQTSVLKNIEIKINITGYFSLITTLIKYKIHNLRKYSKGRFY